MHAGRIARQYVKLYMHLVICTWHRSYYYSHSTGKETEAETGYLTCSRSHGWSGGSAKFPHRWLGSRAVLWTPGWDLSLSNTGLHWVTAGLSWHCLSCLHPSPPNALHWCPQHRAPSTLPPAGPASLHVCSLAAGDSEGERHAHPVTF